MPTAMSGPPVCEFTVEPFLRGRRIETFLGKHLRNYSPYRLQRMIAAGCVTANDSPVDCRFRVRSYQRIRIRLASPPDRVVVPEPIPLDVLFEDPWLVAVNKSAGQIAHPGGDFLGKTLINALQFHVDRQTEFPGLIRPGIVHRIDKQTSGVMVVPKQHAAHRGLTQQFMRGTISKKYLAIVCGRMPHDSGTIDLPIGEVPNPGCKLMCAKPIAVAPKPARTDYQVLERFDDYTFVEAHPHSGRHHQIRVHFAEVGFPLLAEEFYDSFGQIKDGTTLEAPVESSSPVRKKREQRIFWDERLPLRRQALHAAEIHFEHPILERPVGIEAPLPNDMRTTLSQLRVQSKSATRSFTTSNVG